MLELIVATALMVRYREERSGRLLQTLHILLEHSPCYVAHFRPHGKVWPSCLQKYCTWVGNRACVHWADYQWVFTWQQAGWALRFCCRWSSIVLVRHQVWFWDRMAKFLCSSRLGACHRGKDFQSIHFKGWLSFENACMWAKQLAACNHHTQ